MKWVKIVIRKTLSKGDVEFTSLAIKKLGVGAVRVKVTTDSNSYPDIYVLPEEVPPLIVANQVWAKKNDFQRRSEIVHELLHLRGLKHGRVNGMVFSTFPEKDVYSKFIYQKIIEDRRTK